MIISPGVGGAGGVSGTQTTLGGIGTGYIYAGWKGQVAYTTPNMNGFQATVGIVNPNQGLAGSGTTTAVSTLNQDRFGVEGKASYSFAANDVTGKVWVGGASYKVKPTTAVEYTADVFDIGANVNVAGFGATGYYYRGEGVGSYMPLQNGASATGAKRDSDGGYVQLTYVTPIKTKLGVAYGISSLDTANAADVTASALLFKDNERITVGAYHPLTKHLNLVAEYNNMETKAQGGAKNESNSVSLGAILFF